MSLCKNIGKCHHCKKKGKTVDHLATQCDRLLAGDYTRRHNEVVRCIHLSMCRKYGLKSSKKIRNHSVQEVLSNKKATIMVDTRIKTSVKIKHNKPDIFIHDLIRNHITIVEIGITSRHKLSEVEVEKRNKYDSLAKEVGIMYKATTTIISYVVTWDGLVTKYHNGYVKALCLTPNIEAYIQSRVIKKTLESISMDFRRGDDEGGRGIEEMDDVMARLLPANLGGLTCSE